MWISITRNPKQQNAKVRECKNVNFSPPEEEPEYSLQDSDAELILLGSEESELAMLKNFTVTSKLTNVKVYGKTKNMFRMYINANSWPQRQKTFYKKSSVNNTHI